MDFPIVDLFDEDLSTAWVLNHFHPDGLYCPHCHDTRARRFRETKRSRLTVYRCYTCQKTYTLYTGTVFEGRHLRPAQVVLLLRGLCGGEPTAKLARELGLSRSTLHELRQQLQAKAIALQPQTPLPDAHTETDGLVQNAGEKRYPPSRPGRSAASQGQQTARAWHVCQ